MSADKVKFANPLINKATGIKIAPINLLLVLNSTYKYILNKVQVKNSNDSYKLLNGKYPATIHLEQRIKNNKIFAKIVLRRPTFDKLFVQLKKNKLSQYVIIANNKIPKTILDEKF